MIASFQDIGCHLESKAKYEYLDSALKEGQEIAAVEKVKQLFLDKHIYYNIFEFFKSTKEKVGNSNH